MTATTQTSQPVLLWHPAADRHRMADTLRDAALFLETSQAEVLRLVASGDETPRGWTADWAAPSQVEQYNAEKGRARLDRERLERSRRPREGYRRLG